MYLQRKYTDLINHACSEWVNWNPPIPVEVGTYGKIDRKTGDLQIAGNIYDSDFQHRLNKLGLRFRMSDYPPEETSADEDRIIATQSAKLVDMQVGPKVGIANIVDVSLKGQWRFGHDHRDAFLMMRKPRIRFLPHDVPLETLYKVSALRHKYLVTRVHVCPAYSMYLSNKSGEKISLALVAKLPVPNAPGVTVGASGSFSWWSDTQSNDLRKGCDKEGHYCFTPLYTIKRRGHFFSRDLRDGNNNHPLPSGNDMWKNAPVPWDPLDEDGEEDLLDDEEEVNDF